MTATTAAPVTVHAWAHTGPVVPPMTGCGITGPALPLGVTARWPGRSPGPINCPDCVHLIVCDGDECERCQRLALARVTAAMSTVTVCLHHRRARYARVAVDDTITLVAGDSLDGEEPAPEPEPDEPEPVPAGPANPEPVDVVGRAGWRFHLVEGFPPNRVAKPLRKALWAARPLLGGTFQLVIGGDGTRSINIVPDGADPTPDVWDRVHDIAREQLGPAVADRVPETGRHIETIPF